MKTGVCSITFREKSVSEVIDLAEQAALDGIEWGSDVHVPVGELSWAAQVGGMTRQAGLAVSSYGSYYRVGSDYPSTFANILQTAVHLGAPSIRVWAGDCGSDEADDAHWRRVITDTIVIADQAAAKGIHVAFEYHGKTLTDSRESAQRLMQTVSHDNVSLYWQPAVGTTMASRLQDIEAVKTWLSHVHVFHWLQTDKRPLKEGQADWQQYLSHIPVEEGYRYAMLEFVKEDDPEQFLQDADVLHEIIASTHCK